jgi:hypothetical protein
MRGPFALMVALASVLAAGPAAAERLIASLTNHRVMITSSYSGVELVLFGSVEGALAWKTRPPVPSRSPNAETTRGHRGPLTN